MSLSVSVNPNIVPCLPSLNRPCYSVKSPSSVESVVLLYRLVFASLTHPCPLVLTLCLHPVASFPPCQPSYRSPHPRSVCLILCPSLSLSVSSMPSLLHPRSLSVSPSFACSISPLPLALSRQHRRASLPLSMIPLSFGLSFNGL